MITKRIIPCLDVTDGRVVKGVNFAGLQDMADPVEMARYYNAAGADELVFYDITASVEGRTIFTDILRRVASEIFIPLTVGGGIGSLEDFDRVLKCGADKVSVNSGALRDPDLILSDYRLRQHRDGLDAVEQIRARIGQAVPAIVVTGDIAAADLRRVTDAGLPRLHKPVGADRLLAAIEAALDAHPTGGGAAAETPSDSGHEDPAGR